METHQQHLGIQYIKVDDSTVQHYQFLKAVVDKFFSREIEYKKKWNCTFDSTKNDIFCDVGYCLFPNVKELFQVRLGDGMKFPDELRVKPLYHL